MSTLRPDQRFLSSTRGQIVSLLRRGPRTVDELAGMLGLTDNAVRAHLVSLERDNLVTQRGLRRGAGKPAFTYDLTTEAEHLFTKAYAPVLDELLSVLTEQLGEDRVAETLRAVGGRIAESVSSAGEREIQSRLDSAVEVLNSLGGLAESEIAGSQVTIRGYSCPLTSISAKHCEICQLAETLVTEIVGIPMQERCERGERPRCRFEGVLS
jgi:predicted ArsR family transcriptional regulator